MTKVGKSPSFWILTESRGVSFLRWQPLALMFACLLISDLFLQEGLLSLEASHWCLLVSREGCGFLTTPG